jgi:hypothetical protein
MDFHIVKMYKDKEVNKNVKNIFLSICDVIVFLTFTVFQQLTWIRVITILPNSEQSYKGKVKTHKYINRQNQWTTGKLWKYHRNSIGYEFIYKCTFTSVNINMVVKPKGTTCIWTMYDKQNCLFVFDFFRSFCMKY